MIHFTGEEIYKILRTLEETGEAKDCDVAKAKLLEYFKPQQNIEYKRYVFRRAQRQSSETLDYYYTRQRHVILTM